MIAVVVAFTGCASGTTVSGSGGSVPTATPPAAATATTGSAVAGESREVRGFTGVELRSFGNLQIQQTGTESLTIEADADVLPRLTSEVSGGVLRLGVAPGTTINNAGPVVYHLTVATLDSIAVSGAGDATASDLRTDQLTVDIRGAGDVTLAGAVDSQVVTVAGTGSYNGEDLRSGTAEVTIDGVGDAVVQVSDRLDATVSGAGSVEYIGNPQVTQRIRGVGSVERR